MQGQRLNSSKPQRDKSRAMMEKCALLFGFVLGGNMMFQMLGLLWPHLFFYVYIYRITQRKCGCSSGPCSKPLSLIRMRAVAFVCEDKRLDV